MWKRLKMDIHSTEIKDGSVMEMVILLLFMLKILKIKKLMVFITFYLGFIVDMKSQGVTRQKIQNKLAMREVQNYQIYFKNVQLSSTALLP